jgi:hypothetical protein
LVFAALFFDLPACNQQGANLLIQIPPFRHCQD